MLAVGLLHVLFIILRMLPFILNLLRVFVVNGCWILSSAFSALIRDDTDTDMVIRFFFFGLLGDNLQCLIL